MKIIKNSEQDTCPCCGADAYDISFGSFEIVDDTSGFYDCVCQKCDKEFRSYYALVFDSHWEFD